MNRRDFIALPGSASVPALLTAAEKPRQVVLRSSWQPVNIGDSSVRQACWRCWKSMPP